MEYMSAPTPDSGPASPNSVKREGDNTPPDSGRSSPPPNCAICLGACRNKSFTDSCLHQFCFKCLLTWSKVKPECPLCKQNFRSIIHNVQSNHQYEEYMVEQRQSEEVSERIDIDTLSASTSRTFRYRTTLTLPRHESIAIQRLLMQHYPMITNVIAMPPRRRRSPSLFRRTVYRHNLWARPLPDFTGRYRDCTPEFYRYNDSQMHRLMPWLHRELLCLLDENEGPITFVMARIRELLPQHHINSPEFLQAMRRYLGERTEHFLHELYCFASTPYDMTGYDRNVQYTTDSRVSTIVNEVISSGDSDASGDSDIVLIPNEPSAEPSRSPVRFTSRGYIVDPSSIPMPGSECPVRSVSEIPLPIPIETISHTDSDNNSEVMVVGYIKAPEDRTPEVIDLLGSDSDVILQDTPQPEPVRAPDPAEGRATNLVKFSLKWQPSISDSDSDDSTYVPPRSRRRRRNSSSTPTSTDSRGSTPPLPYPNTPSKFSSRVSVITSTSSPSSTTASSSSTANSSSSTSALRYRNDTSTDSEDSDEEKRRSLKRKVKRKSSSERNKKMAKRSTSRSCIKESGTPPPPIPNKSDKRKSYSGKGVKSSKKAEEARSAPKTGTERAATGAEQQPAAGTSSASAHKRNDSDRNARASQYDRKLRSAVQVIKNRIETVKAALMNGDTYDSFTGASCSSWMPVDEDFTLPLPPTVAPPTPVHITTFSSDSEDNLPLNLTIRKLSQ